MIDNNANSYWEYGALSLYLNAPLTLKRPIQFYFLSLDKSLTNGRSRKLDVIHLWTMQEFKINMDLNIQEFEINMAFFQNQN